MHDLEAEYYEFKTFPKEYDCNHIAFSFWSSLPNGFVGNVKSIERTFQKS